MLFRSSDLRDYDNDGLPDLFFTNGASLPSLATKHPNRLYKNLGGLQFKDVTVGGSIPRNYIPAVQTGIEETMARGGVHGFPVVDVAVECYDGKYHSVDSSEMAFKTAASQGFKCNSEEASCTRTRVDQPCVEAWIVDFSPEGAASGRHVRRCMGGELDE